MNETTQPTVAGPVEPDAQVPERGFFERTTADYAAWCKTYYLPDALDQRGTMTLHGPMMSLHGLWAWQEQERRIAAAVAAERERCAKVCRSAVYGRVGSATMRQVADWCAEEIASGRQPLPGA